ncbi:MAG: hypothetical protein A2X84_11510 [Desulfuromonadaceae bacterium GWC2_58_13]|nr:MAG: hypothetical protein A2X84_11510 [Desulfuromonadaceae bacterium GWC2_58_13]
MVVGVMQLEILLHAPLSLKEKRGMVKKILGRCRARFPVSCAETGNQELWQRSHLGFTMVHHDEGAVHTIFDKIVDEIERTGFAEIIDRFIEFNHY